MSATASPPAKHPIAVVCDKIYDADKKEEPMLTLQYYDELFSLVQDGFPEDSSELQHEVLRAWGRAVMAVMNSSKDEEHAMEMIADYEGLLNNGEPCSFLRALTVSGDRPGEVIQNYNSKFGPADEAAVEGCLEKFKTASRTDVREVLLVLDVLHIPITQSINERIQKFYALRMKDEDPEAVLDELKEDGLVPCSAMLYNLILFKPKCERKKPMEYYEEMLDYGIKAEKSTMNIIARRSDLSPEDKQMLQRRRKGDGGPTEDFMRKLRNCVDSKNIEEAERHLHTAMLGGLVPDRHVYKLLIDCCGTDTAKAEQLYNQMVERKIKPTVSTFQKLITIWKDARQDGVDKWVQEMLKHGIEPDTNTITTLLDTYVRSGQRARAIQLLVTMLTKDQGSLHMYNVLMRLGPFDFSLGILGCVLAEDHHISQSAINALSTLARDSTSREFLAALEECNWQASTVLRKPFVTNPLNGRPSLLDCMRLMMREIKLDNDTIEKRTQMLLSRIPNSAKQQNERH